jgi:hypothetical protein
VALILNRPNPTFDPSKGLLRAEHFQMAYATNDIARARDMFADRFGIKEFRTLQGPLPQGGQVHIELAWVGTTMYELMFAQGPGSDIYMSRLPAGDDFVLKHHHLGFLIPDQAQWDALMGEIERGGWSMPHKNEAPEFITSCFVDVPALGHYFEYLLPSAAGMAFFDSVPGN